MQWEMSHFNENTKKSKKLGAIFLSSVVLCNFFLVFFCLNERKFVVINIPSSATSRLSQVDLCWIYSFLQTSRPVASAVAFACHFSTQKDRCNMAAYVTSRFRGHAD